MKLVTRLQDRGRESRFVRRIGEVLCFEAEPEAVLVSHSAFTRRAAVQVVAGIKLDTRLRGEDVELAACYRINDGSDFPQSSAIQNKVVVVA